MSSCRYHRSMVLSFEPSLSIRGSGEPLQWWWRYTFIMFMMVYWRFYDGCRSGTISMMYRNDRYGIVCGYYILNALAVWNAIRYIKRIYGQRRQQVTDEFAVNGNGNGNGTGSSYSGNSALQHAGKLQQLKDTEDTTMAAFIYWTLVKIISFTCIFCFHTGAREVTAYICSRPSRLRCILAPLLLLTE
jgi:hypothetical protein